MKINYLLTTLLILFFQLSIAQVGIGTTSPDPSSELDVSSPLNDKGVLIPRMTQAQRNLIASPATSLLIYQIDNTPGFYYYNGTIWVGITAGASTDWTLLGNAGTSASTNFFGTTDDVDIVLKRNNIRAGYLGKTLASDALGLVNRRNTSFGTNSLLTPATGYRNTAIGTNVMTVNGSGNRNVAVGDAAMASNTTGQQNVAVGVGALFTNQLGNSNVAIGRNALTLTNGTTGTQASNNTAVGMVSMELNKTGAYNSAFGRESLYNNDTGDYNVGVGWKAGFANTVGINNVSIGNSAGLGSTGSNNITIGAFSEVSVLANSDQLSIGNVLYGKDMTTTAAGKIGIGESNPNAKLHVTSSSIDNNGIINSFTPTTDISSNRTGIFNSISGASNDILVGQFNNVSGTGTGIHYGVSNNIISANSSYIYATNTVVNSNSNTMGNNNFLTNNSALTTSSVVGYNSNLAGTSNGTIKGTDTSIGVSGTGNHYGNYNSLSGNGNTVGGSSHLGNFNLLSGTGTTDKYGSYNRVITTAGGTHYGVYSEVLKAGTTNFAGYFLGNVGIGTTTVNTYTLPVSRATTAGQIMQTNAAGVVTWQTPAAALNSSTWLTTGNTSVAADFLGTNNAFPLRFVTSATERMRIVPTGEVVVGSTTAFTGDVFSSYAGAAQTAINGYGTGTGEGGFFSTTGTGNASFFQSTGNVATITALTNNNGASARVANFQSLGTTAAQPAVFISSASPNNRTLNVQNSSAATTVMTGFFNQSSTGLTNPFVNASAVWAQSSGIRGGTFLASGASANTTVLEGSYIGTAGNFDGFGVFGSFNPNPGWGFGVVGEGGFFGLFAIGDVGATGVKPFTIDHPTDPENKLLKHFAIESNEVLNMYRGNALLDSNGEAVVSLPDYFDDININISYNLTPIGSKADVYIKEEIVNNQFKIAGGNPNQKISWQVYGERNDLYLQKYPEKREVEIDKKQEDIGYYMMPELYNLPKERGLINKHKSDPTKVKVEESKIEIRKK